jgi:hypothetical protein
MPFASIAVWKGVAFSESAEISVLPLAVSESLGYRSAGVRRPGNLDSSEKELHVRDGLSSDRAAPVTIAVRTAFAAKLDSAGP